MVNIIQYLLLAWRVYREAKQSGRCYCTLNKGGVPQMGMFVGFGPESVLFFGTEKLNHAEELERDLTSDPAQCAKCGTVVKIAEIQSHMCPTRTGAQSSARVVERLVA